MKNSIKDAGFKLVNVVHRSLFEASKGRLGGTIGGMPVLILETTGRKSGKQRSTMLTAPLEHEGDIVLVASKGGDDRHPAWYLNLQSDPNARITKDGRTFSVVTRDATAEEKDQLWPRIVASYKGYDGYRQRTDRDIPVILCTPT